MNLPTNQVIHGDRKDIIKKLEEKKKVNIVGGVLIYPMIGEVGCEYNLAIDDAIKLFGKSNKG
jgi:hypothetical protein